MTVTVDRDQLRSALARVKPAVARNPAQPILSGVHIDTAAGTIRATDLDRHITATGVTFDGDPTTTVVPHTQMAALIERCPAGHITIDGDTDTIELRAGRITAHLRTLPAAEWPQLPQVTGQPVKLDDEWQAIQAVLHAYDTDPGAAILRNIEMAGGNVSAMTRYYLATRTIDDDAIDLVMPGDLCSVVAKACPDGPVELTVDGRWMQLAAADTTWHAVLPEGDFVTWRNMLPTVRPLRFTVDRGELLDALAVIDTIGPDPTNGAIARFLVVDDHVAITGRNPEIGDTEVVVDATGIDLGDEASARVTFRTDFLRRILGEFAGDIVFEGVEAGGLKPWIVTQGRLTQLLMPVRDKRP